jgi:hypothetical protein
MCERCTKIDAKIARYRRMSEDVDDESVVALIKTFIADLEREKTGFHPKREGRGLASE